MPFNLPAMDEHTIRLRRCAECGAMVVKDDCGLHERWHERIDAAGHALGTK